MFMCRPSVTAALLVEKVWVEQPYNFMTMGRLLKKVRCAGSDSNDALPAASQLDIPHYVLDYESKFGTSNG